MAYKSSELSEIEISHKNVTGRWDFANESPVCKNTSTRKVFDTRSQKKTRNSVKQKKNEKKPLEVNNRAQGLFTNPLTKEEIKKAKSELFNMNPEEYRKKKARTNKIENQISRARNIENSIYQDSTIVDQVENSSEITIHSELNHEEKEDIFKTRTGGVKLSSFSEHEHEWAKLTDISEEIRKKWDNELILLQSEIQKKIQEGQKRLKAVKKFRQQLHAAKVAIEMNLNISQIKSYYN